MPPDSAVSSVKCSIAPWLSVHSAKAIDFYKSAFGAKEVYRLEGPGGGVVVRLSVNGAEFWLSHESADYANASPDPIGGGSIRMILPLPNPHSLFPPPLPPPPTQLFPP